VIVVLAVLAANWASHRVPVGLESTVLLFEANETAGWRELLHTGAVLQGRVRACYPHTRGLEGWNVRAGLLEVRVAPGVPPSWVIQEAMRAGAIELVEGGTEFLPVGKKIKTGEIARPELGIYETVLKPHHFVMAEAYLRCNRPIIEFRLTAEGDARLAAHTSVQSGYYLCLVVDGRVANCPILRTPLVERHGRMELGGNATLAQARTWAALLRSGPLPVTLRAVVTPSVMADDRDSPCIFE